MMAGTSKPGSLNCSSILVNSPNGLAASGRSMLIPPGADGSMPTVASLMIRGIDECASIGLACAVARCCARDYVRPRRNRILPVSLLPAERLRAMPAHGSIMRLLYALRQLRDRTDRILQ